MDLGFDFGGPIFFLGARVFIVASGNGVCVKGSLCVSGVGPLVSVTAGILGRWS